MPMAMHGKNRWAAAVLGLGLLAIDPAACTLDTHGDLAAPSAEGIGFDASAGGFSGSPDANAAGAGAVAAIDSSIDTSMGGGSAGAGGSSGGAGGLGQGGSSGEAGAGGDAGGAGAGGAAGAAGAVGQGGAGGDAGAAGKAGTAGTAGQAGTAGGAGVAGAGGSGGSFQPLDLKIPANNRDGWDDGSNASLDTCYFGNLAWSDVGGYQWVVPLPKGTVIHDAWVVLYSFGPGGTHAAYTAQIRVEDVDNAAAFTWNSDNIINRSWWGTSVSWPIPQAGLPGNQWSQTPSIKDLVQHILNRPGWDSGHYLSISIRGTTGTPGCSEHIADYHEDATKVAILHIE